MGKMFVLGINFMLDLLESDTCMRGSYIQIFITFQRYNTKIFCIYTTKCLYLERIKRQIFVFTLLDLTHTIFCCNVMIRPISFGTCERVNLTRPDHGLLHDPTNPHNPSRPVYIRACLDTLLSTPIHTCWSVLG